jgi:tripartite-type tricarboxylate transporter receptor subunit TctC
MRQPKWRVMPLFAAIVVSAGLSMLEAAAQNYPVKPVRLIAPFPPGGTSDVVCRLVAQKLTEALGKQVVVENRPGAAGNIGHEAAAKSPADGYTLLLTNGAAMITNQFLYKRTGFDPYNDFAPISLVASAGPVLVIHPSVPARSVKELIALAKAKPDRLNFGSGGVGTTSHVVGEVFKTATGVRIVHVPYKGGGLAVIDVVAGQIEMSFSDMVPAVPQVKAGRLRALAVTSEQRSQALPDVPTMAEAGVNETFPQSWWAVVAPKGTPAAVVNTINAAIAQMMKLPDVQKKYAELGVFTVHTTPERVLEIVKANSPQMGRILKAAGVQPE